MSRTRSLGRACMVGALAASGCADAARTATAAVRDSAGIRVVEYAAAPVARRALTVDANPVFRLGDEPAEHAFTRVGSGALLPDGGAVVEDVGGGVLVIGPEGGLRSVLARPGQGPSEVGSIASLHVLGPDTVVLEDDRNGRIALFADGRLARSIDTRRDRTLSIGLRVLDAQPGFLLMATSSHSPNFEDPWLEGHLVRLDLLSETVDTVGTFDLASARPQDRTMNPFAHYGVAAGAGGAFVVGRTDLPLLVWRDGGGAVRQIVRWPPVLVLPGEEHVRLLEERMRRDLPEFNPGMAPGLVDRIVAEQLTRMRIEEDQPLPMFMMLEDDGRGGVWMADFFAGSYLGGSPRYTAIAANGEWLGTVAMPASFRLLDVAGDRILGALRDEMGVESVAVFRLRTTNP